MNPNKETSITQESYYVGKSPLRLINKTYIYQLPVLNISFELDLVSCEFSGKGLGVTVKPMALANNDFEKKNARSGA